jgi:hypothetical protein
MSLKYESGDEISAGDRVSFHGEPGEIEFVVDGLTGDPARDWYVQQFGSGVMVLEPKAVGRAFISDTERAEDLVLISRRGSM